MTTSRWASASGRPRPTTYNDPAMGRMAAIALWCAAQLAAAAPSAVHRVALLAGVNDGGQGRARLRFAASDAQAFGAVMRELGGVAEGDIVMVVEGDRARLLAGLEQLSALTRRARARGTRV